MSESKASPAPSESTLKDLEKGEQIPTADQTVPPTSLVGEQDVEKNKADEASSIEDDLANEKPADQAPLERTKSQAEDLSTARVTLIVLSLCIVLFLAALDMTIVTTALPTIAAEFKASDSGYSWIGSAYLLAAAASVPGWGKISDIFGRKPVILANNVIFMAGSLFCALSKNVGMLIGARILQGMGSGGIVILVNIIISDLFSLRERGKYIGIMGMVWAIASAVGPVVGGAFAEKVSWRWCFYINLPLDGASLVVLVLFLKIKTPKTPLMAGLKAIDWLGIVLVVGAVVMFLIGLQSGGVSRPWKSAYVICLLVFGAVTAVIFFLVQWKVSKYPVIPPRLFTNRTRIMCLLTCFCQGFVFIGASYYVPLYFQTVLGASPLLSGVWTFPYVLSLSFASVATGLLLKKFGQYRPLIIGGVVVMTLGFGLYIDFPTYVSWPRIIIFQIIAGLGVGPNFQSPLVALQTTIKPGDIATATATFGFVRQLSTSLSVVLAGVVLQNQMAKKQDYLVAHLGPKVAAEVGRAASGASAQIIKTLPPAQREIVGTAITQSLRDVWIFYTAIAALSIVFSLFIGKKKLSNERSNHKQGLEQQEIDRQERLADERVKKEEKAKRKSSAAYNDSRMSIDTNTQQNGNQATSPNRKATV